MISGFPEQTRVSFIWKLVGCLKIGRRIAEEGGGRNVAIPGILKF